MEDAEKRHYPSCTKHTKLYALIKMYNVKIKHKISYNWFYWDVEVVMDLPLDKSELSSFIDLWN